MCEQPDMSRASWRSLFRVHKNCPWLSFCSTVHGWHLDVDKLGAHVPVSRGWSADSTGHESCDALHTVGLNEHSFSVKSKPDLKSYGPLHNCLLSPSLQVEVQQTSLRCGAVLPSPARRNCFRGKATFVQPNDEETWTRTGADETSATKAKRQNVVTKAITAMLNW